MNNHQFAEIIRGNFDRIPKNKSNQVRIFLSSTFSDTHTERDYLIGNVYPKLKTYCKSKYGMDFQVFDMRWGINHELTNTHVTTQVCLNEIKNAFLSHRYGSRCLPTIIVESEYLILRDELNGSKESYELSFHYELDKENIYSFDNIFEYCYELDENQIPSNYRLKPIDKILKNFDSKDVKFKNLHKQWLKIEERLGSILRSLAKACFRKGLLNQNQYESYFVSVTENEIYDGILNAKNISNNTLYFVREIEDIEENIKSNVSLAKRFIDLDRDGNVDIEAKSYLENLKNKKIPLKMPDSNTFKFKVKWCPESGISLKSHSDYIKEFGETFYEQCKILIDKNASQSSQFNNFSKEDATLLQEILDHANFCNETAEKFHGRDDLLQKIREYLVSENNENEPFNTPLLIHGASGCGKTAIMAKITKQIFEIVPDPENYSIILRFLGTTPKTSNIFWTLNSVIYQISRIFHQPPPKNLILKDELRNELANRLNEISLRYPNKKLIIILDSIDQLSSNDYDLKWILDKLPLNLKMIYSTLPNHERIFSTFKEILNEKALTHTIEIQELDSNLSITILNAWLKKESRMLCSMQWEIIKDMLKTAVIYPLYVKLLFDIIIHWASFDKPDDEFKKCLNIDRCIMYLFRSLEGSHGKLLFSRTIIYMSSFKNGISENEIEDILSLDDDVLYDIFEFHAPPVRKLPINLWSRIKNDLKGYMVEKEVDDTRVIYWYHRRFIEVANSFYISKLSSNEREVIFNNVVDFFNETWKHKPKPFKYNQYIAQKLHKDEKAEETRETSMQPTVFKDQNGQVRYNKRKINELPSFIAQLTANLAIPLACEHVIFNYNFLNGMILNNSNESIFETMQKFSDLSSYAMSDEAKGALKEIKMMTRIFLQIGDITCSKNSGIHLIISRCLSFRGYQKYFTKLINENDEEGYLNSSLIVPYQNLQSPSDDLIFQMDKHNDPIRLASIGGDNDELVFTLSSKFHVFNMSTVSDAGSFTLKTVGNLPFKNLIGLHDFGTIASNTLKDIPGCFITSTDHEIISYSFNTESLIKKTFDEAVSNIFLLSTSEIIVSFVDKNYLRVYDFLTLDIKLIHEYRSKVKLIQVNTHHKYLNNITLIDDSNIYIASILETNEIILSKFMKDKENKTFKIENILEINSPGYEILDCKFCFDKMYSFDVTCLFITTEDGSYFMLKYPFESSKTDESISFFCIKPKYLNVGLKIIELTNERILFLGTNQKLYFALGLNEEKQMVEIDNGKFEGGICLNNYKIAGFELGIIKVVGIVANKRDLNNYFLVPLFSLEAHFNSISFCFVKDTMLLTVSLDSVLKVFLTSKLTKSTQLNIEFDKNESCVKKNGLRQINSSHVLCLTENSSLNVWKASNGKIIKKLKLLKSNNKLIEECLIDKVENCLIILSKSIEAKSSSNKLLITGYSFKIERESNQLDFKLDFEVDLNEEKNFKLLQDQMPASFLILVESNEKSKLIIYELSYQQFKDSKTRKFQISTIDFNLLVKKDENLIEDVCLTKKSRLIFIYFNCDLLIIDLKTSSLIMRKDFSTPEVNLEFFLSPTNLTLTRLNQIQPVDERDDLIGLSNLNDLVYLKFNNKEKNLKIVTSQAILKKFDSFKISKNILIAFDKHNSKLNLFDLNENINCFKEENKLSIEVPKDYLESFGLSSNAKYVYFIAEKLLVLYLIEKCSSLKKIGEMKLYSNVSETLCTDEYIYLSMKDNRIITFLIADPSDSANTKQRIKALESRSEIYNENAKKRNEILFDISQDAMDSDSDSEGEDEMKKLFEDKTENDKPIKESLLDLKKKSKEKKYIELFGAQIDLESFKQKNWQISLLKQNNLYTDDLKSNNQQVEANNTNNMKKKKKISYKLDEYDDSDDENGLPNSNNKDLALKKEILDQLSVNKRADLKTLNAGKNVVAVASSSKACLII